MELDLGTLVQLRKIKHRHNGIAIHPIVSTMWTKSQKKLVLQREGINQGEVSEQEDYPVSGLTFQFLPIAQWHLCPWVLRDNLHPYLKLFKNSLASSSWFLLLAAKGFK